MPQDTRNAEFIELVYEIAFGDDAINKGYSHEEVLERITEFSINSDKDNEEKWNDQVNYLHHISVYMVGLRLLVSWFEFKLLW